MTTLAEAASAGPHPVHYLPIASTLIAAAFTAVLAARAAKRGWAPHLVWWGIGIFFYGLGTLLESIITLHGNTPTLNTLWYWAGAILGGYPLGVGSLYLLAKRPIAHALTAATLPLVVVASVAVFLSPVDAAAIAQDPHRPGGAHLQWQWVRLLTPFINGFAALFLVGGAFYSCVRFFATGKDRARALGTALIAIGGLLPGIGGSMAKGGIVEALYIGELLGLILIWAGYEVCRKAPRPSNTTPPPNNPQASPATTA